jgi:tRNA threonylcarbamoyladenosine biosynthesis protein TsaE
VRADAKNWYFCDMSGITNVLRFKELEELEAVAEKMLELGAEVPVWLFEGQMGAGKTTLIRTLCKQLGIVSSVHSPTFSLVNEYIGEQKNIVYHFDFYRIKDESEAWDIGLEEYFDSGSFCFVEWPSQITSLWPEQYMLINLIIEEEGERVLTMTEIGKV